MPKFKTFLPVFTGFYNTLFEPETEQELIDLDTTWDQIEWDNKEYEKDVAITCVTYIERELKHLDIVKAIEFECVWSPMEKRNKQLYRV